jgi:hypothetical protein
MVRSGLKIEIQSFVSRCLINGLDDWRWKADQEAISIFLVISEEMEVQPILHFQLMESEARRTWPVEILRKLKSVNLARFAGFEFRVHEIQKVLSSLQRDGVDCLVLKGLPFAMKIYERPHHRPSSDTDVLIDRSALPLVEGLMGEMGYQKTPDLLFGTVSQQEQFSKEGENGLEHVFDFHVELNNRSLLSPFGFDHFSERSEELSIQGCKMRVPKNPEAFILGALHRVGHLAKDRRFLWLYDLKLLAVRMYSEDWRLVTIQAERAQCRALLGQEIVDLAKMSEELVPIEIVEWAEKCRHDRSEISVYYLGSERTRRSDLVLGIRTLPSLSLRILAIGLLVFPRAQYMREIYGGGEVASIALREAVY